MAFGSGTSKRQAGGGNLGPDLDVNDWHEPPKEPRDVKKMFLVAGLGLLSWVATYVGMLELIEANMGDLPLVHKVIIGFSVAMLMTMVIWLLDQLFAPINLFTKLAYLGGYVFLTVISVGFGFGFYWKVLESRSEASRSAEGAVGQVQSALFAASTRLDQLHQTLDGLTTMSAHKAETERATGTSCPNSRPGDGPRRKLRDDDAARFKFAAEFVQGRVGAVKGEMGALNGDLAKILADDKSIVDVKTGTRNEFMKALSRKLDMTVTGFNAFRSDPQLKQIRTDLAERADRATFPDTKGATFNCPDPQLSTALKGVVRAIDELPVLEKPKIAAVEGSEATIEAFRRLTATFYGLLSFKMPPSADELRELQKKAVQSVEMTPAQAMAQQKLLSGDGVGLSKRDYVPLAIAMFVDLCLLLVSMGRPMNRLGSLVPKMREAERGPVIQILSRFNDIHRDPEIRRNFEVFRHVVFDFHGDYYVAVPLDAPFGVGQRRGPNGRVEYYSQSPSDVSDHQVEAHILANLFTSFEKERIFARVYSPFLTTRTIQKRLARQGSKFAHAKAFRIYRFRDGAWSEIILGAVMGAARRVEAEKRARNLAEGHRLPGADTTATAPLGQPIPQSAPTTTAAPVQSAQAAASAPSGHAPETWRPGQPVPGATVASASRPARPHGFPPQVVRNVSSPHEVPAEHVSKFGPYAAHVEPAHDEGSQATRFGSGDVDQTPQPTRHANNNTSPSAYALGAQGHGAHGRLGHPAPPRPAPPRPAPGQIATGTPVQAPAQPSIQPTPPQATSPRTISGRPAMAGFAAATAAAALSAVDEHKVIAMPGIRPVDSVIPDVRPADLQPARQAAAATPLAAPAEDTITYELKRETLTATVPVSQAALPEALLARMRQAREHGEATSVEIVAAPVARIETPPAPLAAPVAAALPAPGDAVASATTDIASDEVTRGDIDDRDGDDSDVIVLGPAPDEWTDEDHAMLSRFAKRPA